MDIASAQRIPIIRQMLSDGTARDIRKRAGLSLADVGAVVGVDQVTVYRWETGKRTPRSEHALKLDALLRALDQAATTPQASGHAAS